jgi:hypothetical protein
MRRRRRRITRSNPRPPSFWFYRVKTPLHMTMFVLCYGQRAQPQPLARVVQTGAVGMVRLMVGELAFGVPNRLRSGHRAGHAHVRGDCIQSKGRNAFHTLLAN